jgi:hypothetical protein
MDVPAFRSRIRPTVCNAGPRLMPNPNASQEHGLHGPAPTGVAAPPESAEEHSAAVHHDSYAPATRAQVWMHRLLVLVFVFVCAAAGVLLVILPWTTEWTDNILLLRYPDLRTVITNGFFRGFCTGLGLLDIWIGFSEAIHYHEEKHP